MFKQKKVGCGICGEQGNVLSIGYLFLVEILKNCQLTNVLCSPITYKCPMRIFLYISSCLEGITKNAVKKYLLRQHELFRSK